jgi:7-cyano-7-deazaguanine reductase
MNDKTEGLKALGEKGTEYKMDEVDATLLEKFESPTWRSSSGAQTIQIQVPEFTSLCPITGQPDFATIQIEYCPRQWCVESKSLKLYMFSFRNQGEFHESCVNRITNDLANLLEPWWVTVQGQFTPRGGIPFWPSQKWEHPELVQ